MATRDTDINLRPICNRTMDPDEVPGSSTAYDINMATDVKSFLKV